MQDDAWRAAPHPSRLEQRIKRHAVAIYQIAKELRAGDETQRLRRRGIGLDNPQIADPHKGNGFDEASSNARYRVSISRSFQ